MMSAFVVTTVLLIVAMGLLRVETTEAFRPAMLLYSENLGPNRPMVNGYPTPMRAINEK